MIETAVPAPPTHLGRYKVLARLGRGGMGEVFLGCLEGDGGFEKLVVLKRPLPHLHDSRESLAMFLDEARIAASLSHHNVCQVYELHCDGGQVFIAMEYLRGVPLSSVLSAAARRGVALPLPFVVGLAVQIAAGLHHAHESRTPDGVKAGLVHRDVAPTNLFVTRDGVAKILDFGIAKARGRLVETQVGVIKGKLAYSSPEQHTGAPLDRRSDVFSLGVVIFEALTLRRLFHRRSDFDTQRAALLEPIPRLDEYRTDAPAALVATVARALERDRERRFATAHELGRSLAAAMACAGGVASAVEIAARLQEDFGDELGARDDLARPHRRPASESESTVTFVVTPPSRPAAPAPGRAASVEAFTTGPTTVLDPAEAGLPPRAAIALATPPAPTPRHGSAAPGVAPAGEAAGVDLDAPASIISLHDRRDGRVPWLIAALVAGALVGWFGRPLLAPTAPGPELRARAAVVACLASADEPVATPIVLEVEVAPDGNVALRTTPRLDASLQRCVEDRLMRARVRPASPGTRVRYLITIGGTAAAMISSRRP